MLKFVLDTVDGLWNLHWLKNYRTKLAKAFFYIIGGYQAVATSQELISRGYDMPDIPIAVYAALLAYFTHKVDQFAREHTNATPIQPN